MMIHGSHMMISELIQQSQLLKMSFKSLCNDMLLVWISGSIMLDRILTRKCVTKVSISKYGLIQKRALFLEEISIIGALGGTKWANRPRPATKAYLALLVMVLRLKLPECFTVLVPGLPTCINRASSSMRASLGKME